MNDNLNQTEFSQSAEPPIQIDPNAELRSSHQAMLKEIRSWGFWSLGLGVAHLISSGYLNSAWGILLIIVGLGSFYFRTAPMFIIYTVTLAWAAVSNLGSLSTEWMFFALVQFYMAYRTFKDYQRFGKIEAQFIQLSSENTVASRRAANTFPWIGMLLGFLSIFGCIAYWAITFVIVAGFGLDTEPPALYIFLIRFVEIVGIIGFSVSLASLLAKHTPKALPIIGLIAGSMIILMFLAMNIFLAFS